MKAKKFTKLPDEDRQRMARLYEEVKGRLTEMSMIVGTAITMAMHSLPDSSLRPQSQPLRPVNTFDGLSIQNNTNEPHKSTTYEPNNRQSISPGMSARPMNCAINRAIIASVLNMQIGRRTLHSAVIITPTPNAASFRREF